MRKYIIMLICALFLLFMLVIDVKAQVKFEAVTFYPLDQGQYIEDFKDFREGLQEIVKNKDVVALKQIIAPDVHHSFGMDGTGIKSFLTSWELDKSQPTEQNEQFWRIFEKILKYGGAFSESDVFMAPYYYSSWPEGFDAYEYGTVIGENVNIYKNSSDILTPIGTLTYKIIKFDYNDTVDFNNKKYLGVFLPTGEKVYINDYYAASPIGYRAIFTKNKENHWKMTVFVAGD
jgi:hypothetical protein